MSWTDDRVELLKKLWLDGRSASQISNELGGGVTRNAVIGKVHRMGLSGRVKSPESGAVSARPKDRQPARPHTPRPTGPSMRGNLALAMSPRAAPQPAPRPVENVVIPISERVTLMELKEAMCRWPLGDPATPDFRFCGIKSPGTLGPYCGYHASVAYQPAQDRRRERDRERRAMLRHG
jgi:GcrA cell cycle regulator